MPGVKPSVAGRARAVEVVVSGTMSDRMRRSFPDLQAATVPEGTRLTGTVADEAALHGVLARCRDLHLELVSVRSGAPEASGAETVG
jgi:hypothetical protein